MMDTIWNHVLGWILYVLCTVKSAARAQVHMEMGRGFGSHLKLIIISEQKYNLQPAIF